MKVVEYETARRHCIQIDGENFYVTLGDNFITTTVPRENDPNQSEIRRIMNIFCNELTKSMGGSNE